MVVAVSSSRDWSRAQRTTFIPSCARRRAIARPMPRLEPVTITVFITWHIVRGLLAWFELCFFEPEVPRDERESGAVDDQAISSVQHASEDFQSESPEITANSVIGTSSARSSRTTAARMPSERNSTVVTGIVSALAEVPENFR